MDPFQLLFYFFIIVPSAILHEYAHGVAADWLGDPTARYAGRLSINPLVHIDPIGTILMPLLLFFGTSGSFLFAYAKPVPYNPYNLRDQRWGPVLVAVAGPFANFFLAGCFAILLRFLPGISLSLFLAIIVYANILLGVFNLVPIPPLDGSKILYAVMPDSWFRLREQLDRYGFVLLLVFVLFFFSALTPIIQFLFSLFTGTQFFL